MQTAPYPDVPPDFGNYLAGLIDGEGCFSISVNRRQGNFHCRVGIRLRDDDIAILDEIRERTGCGRVARYHRPRPEPWNTRPYALWHVVSRGDCARMAALLDMYPLRAKKARDFAVWREAVAVWGRIDGKGHATSRARNEHVWTRMAELKREMEGGRAYQSSAPDLEVAGLDPVPAEDQLVLDERVAPGEVA